MSTRWIVERAIEEKARDIEMGLRGPSEETRLYNAETMAAAAREAQPMPIHGEDEEPYLAHVYGYLKGQGGFTRFPMGDGGAKPFLSTGFAYSALSQVLGEVAEWGQRLVMGLRIGDLRAGLPIMMSSGFEVADSQTAKGEMGDPVLLRQDLLRLYDGFLDNWGRGIISGDGAAFSSYMEQMVGAGSLFSAYKNLMYQASVIPRMRRYWMALYSPTVPDERLAWTLFRRGILKEGDFIRYCRFEGWEEDKVDWLKGAFKAIPNENAAFRMFKRGVISDEVKKAVYFANSWDEGYFDYLDAIYQRIPTPRDAFNMFMRGAITETDFDSYVEKNEWESDSAARLWAIYQNLPRSHDAFTLFRRGKIDKNTLTALYKADGFMSTYQNILSSLFERIPHPRDAFNALMRGAIDRKTFDGWVYANEWFDGAADFLYDIYQKQPTAREAFYMWAKGLITIAQRDQLYSASGYDSSWHQKITENNYYVPTVYDLTRIADYVEIDSIWATRILTERGLRDRDKGKILAMLKVRPLRDEIRRQLALWVKRYRYGWVLPTDLEEALQEYLEGGYIQATEKTLIIEEAELNYEDELMEEKIDIYSWYYKTAVISEEELLQDFLDLGIREEKANLMVELLKAQGYYGYY